MKRILVSVAVLTALCAGAMAADEQPRVWVLEVGEGKCVKSEQPLACAADVAARAAKSLSGSARTVVLTTDAAVASLLQQLLSPVNAALVDSEAANPSIFQQGQIACLRFEGEYGDLFAETVQTRLAASGAVHLVERMRLAEALTELKLQDTAAVDASSVRRLGKLVGAKYVLVGSSRKGPDGNFHVNCRLVVAETGLDVPGVAALCSAEPLRWEGFVVSMADELLGRIRGTALPGNAR